ncbi:MAG: GNAT family N-acetyltransferase, partial [Planctomycetia bacterium]|nr:GNAT family N-acetyltransferase [Planctomycetia bacterium]
GQLVATDYLLSGQGVVYAYQGGIDPRRLALGPGRLLAVAEIRQAIAEGREAFDLLRGNEPFKAHLRAQPRATIDYRVAGDGLTSRVRHAAWLARREARHWIRQGLQLADDARRFTYTPTANHA